MAPRPPPVGWPPLITHATQPWWMPWRDRTLTLAMWCIFFLVLETELQLFVSHMHAAVHGTDPEVPANWQDYWDKLQPFVIVIAALVVWLCVFGFFTVLRRRAMRHHPIPPPLDMATEAAHAGLSIGALTTARRLDLAVAHLDDQGHYRIEAHTPS